RWWRRSCPGPGSAFSSAATGALDRAPRGPAGRAGPAPGNEPCCSAPRPSGRDARKIPESRMRNAMSVDVEDWFHPEAVRGFVPQDWSGLELRVSAAVGRLLDLFAAAPARATLFVLGWLAQPPPHP